MKEESSGEEISEDREVPEDKINDYIDSYLSRVKSSDLRVVVLGDEVHLVGILNTSVHSFDKSYFECLLKKTKGIDPNEERDYNRTVLDTARRWSENDGKWEKDFYINHKNEVERHLREFVLPRAERKLMTKRKQEAGYTTVFFYKGSLKPECIGWLNEEYYNVLKELRPKLLKERHQENLVIDECYEAKIEREFRESEMKIGVGK